MEENEMFLKYLIDEEIYIVDEKTTVTPGDEPLVVEDRNIEESPEKDGRQMPDRSTKSNVAAETDIKEDGNKSLDEENTTVPGSSGDNKPAKRYQDITVLLLDYDDQTSMAPGHMDLLANILQSVNLSLDSVEMVFRDEFDKLEVKSFIDCPVIAFLTAVPENLSASFAVEKYMINMINGNQFVACDSLNDLNQNRSLKIKLWEQLKLIYRI